MPILAHLDLDAFFAAVEELEDPELREKPLVVGGDPHGRGVVATANYVARTFGIHSAMSSAEALRRCPHAIFVRPRHSLYKQYSRAVWDTIAEVVPRIERTGIDEGYLDIGTVARDFVGRASGRLRRADLGARDDQAHLLARRLDLEGRLQDRVRPAEARRHHRRAARARGRLPRAAQRPAAARRRPPRRGAAAPCRNRHDRRPRRARRRRAQDAAPGYRRPLLRDRARGIDPRDLELAGETDLVSAEDTFPRDISERAHLHVEVRRLAELVAERLRDSGLSGRTVTAKLRYGDFSIRTRSTTLPAGVDEADVIGDVACGLLDRGLRDRPGALRLVGVGVSGLSPYRQLTFA